MVKLYKKVYIFFDKLEDKVRGRLSRYPIFYTMIGGTAVVLFWRGVWDTADMVPYLNGPVSIVISVIVLLITGLFVSFFVTDRILLSGIKQEKKIAEKTESEVRSEGVTLDRLEDKITTIQEELEKIEKNLNSK